MNLENMIVLKVCLLALSVKRSSIQTPSNGATRGKKRGMISGALGMHKSICSKNPIAAVYKVC
jgi:hypothetical protein